MLSVVVCGKAPELFFVFAYSVGDGFDGGAQGGDLVGESGQGAAGGGLVAVLVDERGGAHPPAGKGAGVPVSGPPARRNWRPNVVGATSESSSRGRPVAVPPAPARHRSCSPAAGA